jgi:hypothetical protein
MNNNREILNSVIQGQAERNVTEQTKKIYISQCKVMTSMIFNAAEDIRDQALVKSDNGTFLKHTGMAKDVYKLKLPMELEVAQLLFDFDRSYSCT